MEGVPISRNESLRLLMLSALEFDSKQEVAADARGGFRSGRVACAKPAIFSD
jgi:hypothetical protein